MRCNPFDKCIVFSDNRSKAVIIEKKRRYCGINNEKKNVNLMKVDNCLIKGNSTEKCDFLLLTCKKEVEKKAYFIELKGKDFLHGIDQLISSIKLLGDLISDFDVNARIIVTKVYAPDLNYSRLIRLKRLLKQKGGNFIKAEKNLEELI